MSINRTPKLDYTLKYQIKAGRVNFANYAQKKQLIQEGRLLGLNLYPPDNDASIITLISEGEINTTPEELAGYLEEIVLPPSSTIPDAPTGLSGVSGNQQVTISFTPGFDGGSPITNYQYSTDNGSTFRAFSPVDSTSPVTITTLSSDGTTPLTNGTSYTIKLKAINSNGSSTTSLGVSVTPSTIPDAPTGLSGLSGNQQVTISFTPGFDGGSPITNYQYSTDNGSTFRALSPVDSTSPVTITTISSDGVTPLSSDTTYTIKLKAVNANGEGTESAGVSVTPLGPGSAIWATYIDGTNNDIGLSVAFDSSNNVYITGYYISTGSVTLKNASGNTQVNSSVTLPSTSSSTNQALFIVKYNSSGIVQWATYLNGSGNDIGYSIAFDSADNLYITGQYGSSASITLKNASGNTQVDSSITLPSTSLSTNQAIFIIKYNTSGIAQWATYLNGSGNDIGFSIAIDSSDNIYITGQYTSSGIVTLKNASGNTQVDSSITLPNTISQATILMKYNTSGIAQWATYFDGSGQDIGYSIAFDSSNNLYITGYYTSSGNVTLKNASGNTQVNSSIILPVSAIQAIFIVKYNSSGIAQWATYLDGTGNDIGFSIVIDSSNNLYIAGGYRSSGSVTLKNASGDTQVDSSITLPFTPPSINQAIVIMKYNSSGIAQWATYLDGTINNTARSITIDSSNNLYISGSYSSSGNVTLKNASGSTQVNSSIILPNKANSTTLIMKYNSSGISQWATYLDGISNGGGNSIKIDSSNNLYITGSYSSLGIATLKNAFGNTQIDSSIKLPATTAAAVLLMKYIS